MEMNGQHHAGLPPTRRERPPRTFQTGSWVYPRAGPENSEGKFLTFLELEPSAVELTASHYTDCAIRVSPMINSDIIASD
jgi:hypothetical protein